MNESGVFPRELWFHLIEWPVHVFYRWPIKEEGKESAETAVPPGSGLEHHGHPPGRTLFSPLSHGQADHGQWHW